MHSALTAVRLASKLCQRVQLQLKAGEKTDKADESPVTVADYGAQALVAWSLQRSLPNQPFSMVAEEDSVDLRQPEGAGMAARITAMVNEVVSQEEPGSQPLSEADVLGLIDTGGSEGGSQGRHWVLDPIDGTRGFVGMRQYAVCLGLLDQGQVVVGVLGCPNLPGGQIQDEDGAGNSAAKAGTDGVGVIFAAQKGAGSYAGPLAGSAFPRDRLQLSDTQNFSQIRFMESYESKHSDFSFTAKLAAKLGVSRPALRIDSQAKYGALARGDAAINLRFPRPGYREKIWDHAAGALIVQEAGGVISDASGAPLDFGKGRWLDLDRGIVSATPAVHAALLQAIQEVSQSGD
ncbi:3',5'-bisphosphate nucleotidase [Coccomyxa subellipsoidea C-169]|uniref:3'(2'),5'-bisphosphate nucleotidase n=1 Tax=Coccomyxa subellipsoidea (strain C-169) TaxID=574566 RepID=I0YNT8_COCSC|nr:3',5'-bisphosphate nucleotidase [Coccomyxa subellipsoidea C-169]EIE20057.1 3',5'-bisphosphate nucleotidase [Coccomyxa subellipsoidea C-169]|eukprot:XP_005644601.1 3',5'-bisphosphate nucleotidase [Coccomyxa subellipsoidea C-169]